jgi:hydroxylaminobenzene mutase
MENLIATKKQANQLIILGVLLFLLGLIVGLFVPIFANPRMGLSSHIEGVLNGMLLILIGLVWSRLELSGRWLSITFWLAVYGTFANWLGILIAAIFDAGKMLTVAADGKEGSPVVEGIVNFSLISLSVAMIMVSIIILIGLVRSMKTRD